MTQSIPFTITPSGIVMFVNSEHLSVPQDHPKYTNIKEALLAKRWADVPALCDTRKVVKNWISKNPRFVLSSDRLALDGRTFSDAVTEKILNMIDVGHSPDALFNFLIKTRQNPSNIAQAELLLFCVANDFMIHEDGDIIAYKSVRGDYTDMHSGTVSNKVSNVCKMDRNGVDDNRDRTCSHGLHFASFEYANGFGSGHSERHLMLLKVNPKNVVSIPSDYHNQKGRTCEYTVFGEIKQTGNPLPKKEVYTNNDFNSFDDVEDGWTFGDCPCQTDSLFDCEGYINGCECQDCVDLDTLEENATYEKDGNEINRKVEILERWIAERDALPKWRRDLDKYIWNDKLDKISDEIEALCDTHGFEIPDALTAYWYSIGR